MMKNHNTAVFVEGRYFCEAPRWHHGRFWFSDFFAHEVCSAGLDGEVRVEASFGDEQPSGLGWLPNGDLLVVGMTRREVLRVDAAGTHTTHANLRQIATFHTNDMLVASDGSAYVGNFGFDLDHAFETLGVEGLIGASMTDPTPFVAKLAHITPEGVASVAAADLLFPNGMALLDGGRTLVVAETIAFQLTAFDRAADGSLSNRRPWASLRELGVAPDGICADDDGGIWVAAAVGPKAVRVEEGGRVTDTVTTSNVAYACALGGPDGRHLLVCTAPSSHSAEATANRAGRLELVEL